MTEQRTPPDRRMTDGRRQRDQAWREAHAEITRRLEQGDQRMNAQDAAIAENTGITQETRALAQQTAANTEALAAQTKRNTDAVVETRALAQQTATNTDAIVKVFGDLAGAFRVLEGVGKLARPVGYIVMLGSALVGLWTAIKTGAFWK